MAKVGRFRFSLGRVLGVREVERSAAGAELAEANQRLRDAEARVLERQRIVHAELLHLAELRARREIPILECLRCEEGIDWERRALTAAQLEMARCRERQEAARSAYAQRLQAVRALERLRDLRREEHAQAKRKEESKAMDEVASARSQAQSAT